MLKFFLVLNLIFLTSCGPKGDTSSETPTIPAPSGEVGPNRGEEIYTNSSPSCLSCHGNSAFGGVGPNIRFIDKISLENALNLGPSTMPTYSLSPDDLTALHEYLNSF